MIFHFKILYLFIKIESNNVLRLFFLFYRLFGQRHIKTKCELIFLLQLVGYHPWIHYFYFLDLIGSIDNDKIVLNIFSNHFLIEYIKILNEISSRYQIHLRLSVGQCRLNRSNLLNFLFFDQLVNNILWSKVVLRTLLIF